MIKNEMEKKVDTEMETGIGTWDLNHPTQIPTPQVLNPCAASATV